jgi:hypothetical protein
MLSGSLRREQPSSDTRRQNCLNGTLQLKRTLIRSVGALTNGLQSTFGSIQATRSDIRLSLSHSLYSAGRNVPPSIGYQSTPKLYNNFTTADQILLDVQQSQGKSIFCISRAEFFLKPCEALKTLVVPRRQ